MPVVIPTLKKKCKGECGLEKDFNDDFGNDSSKPDFKDIYCKVCRKQQLSESRARGKCKNKVIPGKRNQYFKERKLRLFGENTPISDSEMQELIIYLQNPEAWEGISETRTRDMKVTLRRQLHQMKYYSQWFPTKK